MCIQFHTVSVGEVVFSSRCIFKIFVKNQDALAMRVYIWVFYSILSIAVSVTAPVPRCLVTAALKFNF